MQRLLEQIHRQVVADGSPERRPNFPHCRGARLSLSLLTQPGVAVFWPAAGVASGTVIAFGRAAWWQSAKFLSKWDSGTRLWR